MYRSHAIFCASIALSLNLFGCSDGGDDVNTAEPKPVVASISTSGQGGSDHHVAPEIVAMEPETRLPMLTTEEAVIEYLMRLIERQDIAGIQEVCTQEYAIDLRRLHDQDPHGFWRRGAILHRSIASGFELVHRQDDTEEVWHVVVAFGDGIEERMSFSRVNTEIRLAAL